MILVLLGAAGLSLWAGGGEDWLDAAIILGIVAVNACISLSQEDSAQRALDALRQMSAPQARVIRGGREVRLDAQSLVPGDVIRLEAGDLVPGRRPHSGGGGAGDRRERPHRRVRPRGQAGRRPSP